MKCPLCGVKVKNKKELELHLESTLEQLEIDAWEVQQELDKIKN